MRLILDIPMRAVSWNTLARKSHWLYTAAFKDMKENTLYVLRMHGRIRPFEKPVSISVHASWKGKRRHDASNIVLKPIEDLLVSEGILKDDDLTHVRSVTFTGENGCGEDRLRVTLDDGGTDS
jgi:Holliday junction resolvase RusA-like endonuclease